MTGGLLRCANCEYKASVTAGTIFQRTRTPLTQWFRAIWWISVSQRRISARGLQRNLGLRSYETAWSWCLKLRRTMVHSSLDRLGRDVELGVICIPAEEEGKRILTSRALVAIAVEGTIYDNARIRLGRVSEISTGCLLSFAADAIDPGSTVYTDEKEVYKSLSKQGYRHEVAVSRPTIVSEVGSSLIPWLLRSRERPLNLERLDYCLDAFTFYHHARGWRSTMERFEFLMKRAMASPPLPYKQLVAYSRSRSRPARKYHQ